MALVSWAPWRPDGRNEDMSLETLAIVLETYYLDVNEKTTAEGRKMLCFSCDVTFFVSASTARLTYSYTKCFILHATHCSRHQQYSEDPKRHGVSLTA